MGWELEAKLLDHSLLTGGASKLLGVKGLLTFSALSSKLDDFWDCLLRRSSSWKSLSGRLL
jgi:hypothetical protein